MNIAHAYPDLYAAVGVHSGLAAGCARDLGSALMAMQVGAPGFGTGPHFGAPVTPKRIPTIVFHGTDDGTVSVRNADQILTQAEASGLTAIAESVEATAGDTPTSGRATPTGTAGSSSRIGASGASAMRGRAGGRRAATPIPADPTPRGRCSTSSPSTASPRRRERNRLPRGQLEGLTDAVQALPRSFSS